jgi:outer membrane protein assembly factor BamB
VTQVLSRLVSMALFVVISACWCSAASEWPGWRGPGRDAVSPDENLLPSWDGPPPLVWTGQNLGSGYSSVAIADGKVFTMGDRDRGQWLIALSDADGRELWAAEVSEDWEDRRGDGPRSTPVYDDGRVYALSSQGDLVCVDAERGEVLWRKDFKDDFGGRMMSGWGFSESPLVDGDKLICTPGSDEAFIVALDKANGREIWRANVPQRELGGLGKDGAGYASLVISNAAGVKQYVTLAGRGLVSVAADDGRFLWGYNRIANDTANIPTPIVTGDYVFGSSAYGAGSALLRIVPSGDGLRAEEVYFLDSNDLQNHHGGMVLVDGYVYCGHGHNQGFPQCTELATGEQTWRRQRGPGSGSAAVAYADGRLYFRYQDGTMALIEANPQERNIVGQFRIPESGDPSWSHPVVINGRLYLREQDKLYVHDVRAIADRADPQSLPAPGR